MRMMRMMRMMMMVLDQKWITEKDKIGMNNKN